jgi:hypothetical protein
VSFVCLLLLLYRSRTIHGVQLFGLRVICLLQVLCCTLELCCARAMHALQEFCCASCWLWQCLLLVLSSTVLYRFFHCSLQVSNRTVYNEQYSAGVLYVYAVALYVGQWLSQYVTLRWFCVPTWNCFILFIKVTHYYLCKESKRLEILSQDFSRYVHC